MKKWVKMSHYFLALAKKFETKIGVEYLISHFSLALAPNSVFDNINGLYDFGS